METDPNILEESWVVKHFMTQVLAPTSQNNLSYYQRHIFDDQPYLGDGSDDFNNVHGRPSRWFYEESLIERLYKSELVQSGKDRNMDPVKDVSVVTDTVDSEIVTAVIFTTLMKGVSAALAAYGVIMECRRPNVPYVPDIIGYVKSEPKLLMITETSLPFDGFLQAMVGKDGTKNGVLNWAASGCPKAIPVEEPQCLQWSIDGIMRKVRTLFHDLLEHRSYGRLLGGNISTPLRGTMGVPRFLLRHRCFPPDAFWLLCRC